MKLIKITAVLFLLSAHGGCAASSVFRLNTSGGSWAEDHAFGWGAQICCTASGKVPILFLCRTSDGEEMEWDKWAWNEQEEMNKTETIFSLVPKRAVFLCRILRGDNFPNMQKALDYMDCYGATAKKCYVVRISKTRKLIVASYMHENQGPTRCFETGIHLESPAWIQELSVLLDGLEEPAVQEGLGDPAALWDSFHNITGSGKNAWEAYV